MAFSVASEEVIVSDPMLIVAGIPIALYQRIKTSPILQSFPGWQLRIIPSKHYRRASLHPGQVQEVVQLSVGQGVGSHVLAFSGEPKDNIRDEIRELRRHFRFRWIRNEYLGFLPVQVDVFVEHIKREAEFEVEWRQVIQPKDVGSPLLLPERSFTPRTKSHIWQQASRISPPRPDVRKAQIRSLIEDIEGFRDAHRDGQFWNDSVGLKFSNGYHSEPPAEIWYWKYNWRVPDFFHYDVTHFRNSDFEVRGYDQSYNEQRFFVKGQDHINTDCHGRCRKGTRPLSKLPPI